MDDLISRQAAIDALERKKDKNAKGDIAGFYNQIIQNDIDTLMQLPSAQPERKKGKWIFPYETTTMVSICSECGTHGRGNFCPNCGADMRGERNG